MRECEKGLNLLIHPLGIDSKEFSIILSNITGEDVIVVHELAIAKRTYSQKKIKTIFLFLPSTSKDDLLEFCMSIKYCSIIIISPRTEFAIDMYELDQVIDFLPFPFSSGRLMSAISRAQKNYNDLFPISKDASFFKLNDKFVKLNHDDIDYITILDDNVVFYSNGNFIKVQESLESVEKKLPTKLFRKIHKSYLVNFSKIKLVSSKSLTVSNTVLPIGKIFRRNLGRVIRFLEE